VSLVFDEIWATDLAWHVGDIDGIEASEQFITGAKAAFSDMHLTEDILALMTQLEVVKLLAVERHIH
jgi:hypothetical protein